MAVSVRQLCAFAALYACASLPRGKAIIAAVSDSECSASEMSTTDTYINEYYRSVTTSCLSDACVSDCLSTVSDLAALLPNCVYSDGVNYYETVVSITSECSVTASPTPATETEDSSPSASDSTCTTSQMSETDSVLEDTSAEYTASCSDDACTIECAGVLIKLFDALPNCIYSDGTNHHESVSALMVDCGTITVTVDDTSKSSTSSSGVSESSTNNGSSASNGSSGSSASNGSSASSASNGSNESSESSGSSGSSGSSEISISSEDSGSDSTPSSQTTIGPATDSSTDSSSNGASSTGVSSLSSFALVAAMVLAQQ